MGQCFPPWSIISPVLVRQCVFVKCEFGPSVSTLGVLMDCI